MEHISEKQKGSAGMTFIEIIVVMGIFTAIAATVLFNYRDFSSGVKLQNLSQEIALQGKRAQTLASQGRLPILTSTQVNSQGLLPLDGWVASYGLAFNIENNPKSFIVYFNSPMHYAENYPSTDTSNLSPYELRDMQNLYFYDFVTSSYTGCGSTAVSECVEELQITDGSYIDLICINAEPGDDPECTGAGENGGSEASQLHISYTRPLLDAYLLDETLVPGDVSHAFIRVSSSDGSQKRYITFWSTGQISVR